MEGDRVVWYLGWFVGGSCCLWAYYFGVVDVFGCLYWSLWFDVFSC